MAQPILPFALPIFLCDRHVARDRGKVDFLGAFHSIKPREYPHTHQRFSVVAHMNGGLGDINTYVDIRNMATGELIDTTPPRIIRFPNRNVLVRLVCEFVGVQFPSSGIYLIELYCEHTCIADTRLRLRELDFDMSGRQE